MKLSQCKGVCSIFDKNNEPLQKCVKGTMTDIELSAQTPYTEFSDVPIVIAASDLKDFSGGIPLP